MLSKPDEPIAEDAKKNIIDGLGELCGPRGLPSSADLSLAAYADPAEVAKYESWHTDIRGEITMLKDSVMHFFDDRPAKTDIGNEAVVGLANLLRGDANLKKVDGLEETITRLVSAVGGAIASAVSHTFATELQSCFTFGQRIAVNSDMKLDGLVDGLGAPAVFPSLCSRQEQRATNYFKLHPFLNACKAEAEGVITVSSGEAKVPADYMAAAVWLQTFALKFHDAQVPTVEDNKFGPLAKHIGNFANDCEAWDKVRASATNVGYVLKVDSTGKLKTVADNIDIIMSMGKKDLAQHASSIVSKSVDDGIQAMSAPEMVEFASIVKDLVAKKRNSHFHSISVTLFCFISIPFPAGGNGTEIVVLFLFPCAPPAGGNETEIMICSMSVRRETHGDVTEIA